MKNIQLSKQSKEIIQERINNSYLTDKEKKALISNLNTYQQNKLKKDPTVINNFFTGHTNKDGLIISKRLSAKESRNLTITPQQKVALEMMQKKIKLRHDTFKIEQEKSTLKLEDLKIGEEDYISDKLNKYNYSDFLNGHLTKHIRPKVTLIVAYDNEYGIGLDGTLPWHIPADLKFFKEYTAGKPVVMGSTNYKDISKVTKGKGLPNRRNIVLSSQKHESKAFEFYQNINDILNALENEKEIVIIGGTMLYETFLPIADEIIATEIDKTFKTDVKFPNFKDKFICVSKNKLNLDTKVSFFDTNIEKTDVYFTRYLRVEPPLYNGIAHIKGKNTPYDYKDVKWTNNNYFFSDVLFYIPPDLLFFSLNELIFNNPLPIQAYDMIMETGSMIIDPSSSIYSWMPDFFTTFMEDQSFSIVEYLDLSNIDFSFLGDIISGTGEVIAGVAEGIFEILGGLF